MTHFALYVELKAKPGKEEEVAKFLESARSLVLAETGTIAWFAVRFDKATFAIFDAFDDEAGRNAHLNGASPRHLWRTPLSCLPWLRRFANLPCWRTSFPHSCDANDGGPLVVITPQADQRGPIKMLKIWGRANSINVQKVLWCCGELGLRYERIDAGNEFGLTKSPEYRALNPNALVPTIEDGDFQLWELKCHRSLPRTKVPG